MRPSALAVVSTVFLLAAGAAFVACSSDADPAAATTATSGAGAGSATSATSGSGSTGAGAGLPGGFPYTATACDYTIDVPPELDEAGFDESTLGASPTPEHIHVSYAGAPTSTFAVNWKTDLDTKATLMLYGTDQAAVEAADGPGEGVTQVLGHHMLYTSILDASSKTRVHEAHACGLAADTTYFYKVGAKGAWSATFDVGTAPTTGTTSTFRFAVTGDSRNDPTIFAQAQEAIVAHDVDFQVFSGDAVALGASQPDWDAFFGATTGSFAVQTALASIPFMVVNGNHDALSVNYVAQFALPQEVSGDELAQGEEWYALDYANAHFVFLNDTPSASIDGAQKDWLAADLAKVDRTKTPWVFAVHHRGAYSCSSNHGSNLDTRAAWQPLYDQYGVDVVWNGHDHDYERSKPIRGFQAGSEDGALAAEGPNGEPVAGSGTVYVVAAGVGAPLYGVDTCFHTQISEKVRNYVIAEIEGNTLRFTAYRLDGSVLDSFEYTK